jgi:hypothetical protein
LTTETRRFTTGQRINRRCHHARAIWNFLDWKMSPEPKSLNTIVLAKIDPRQALFGVLGGLPFNSSLPKTPRTGTQPVALPAYYPGAGRSPLRDATGQRAQSVRGAGVLMMASPAGPLSQG